MKSKDPSVKTINVSKSERDKAKQKMLSIGDGQVGRNINYMIQSRFKIIYIQSHEERRVIDFFRDLSLYRGSEILQWDCDRGLLDAENKEQVAVDDSEVHENPIAVLAHIIDRASNQAKKISYGQKSSEVIFLLLDFHSFLEDAPPQIERKLKEFSDVVSTCTIVIVAPNFVCPSTLEKEITLVDFPVPSYKEVKETLFEVAKAISTKLPKALKQAEDNEEDLVKAASGLTLTESENAYAMTIVRDREFNIKTILDEKKQAIRKSGILEYLSPKFTLDQIGGLDTLKEWLMLRRVAFRNDARSFGLPMPKGILILGIPGCGKSMASEAISSAYKMPLLRLDVGAIFSSHVGESEANIRSTLKIAESVSPCVLGSTKITVNNNVYSIEDFFKEELNKGENSGGTSRVEQVFSKDHAQPRCLQPIQTVVYFDQIKNHQIVSVVDGVLKNIDLHGIVRNKVKEKLLKIKTKSGQEIIVTKNHLLMDDQKNMKRSKDFCIGEPISIVCSSIQGDIDEKKSIQKNGKNLFNMQ